MYVGHCLVDWMGEPACRLCTCARSLSFSVSAALSALLSRVFSASNLASLSRHSFDSTCALYCSIAVVSDRYRTRFSSSRKCCFFRSRDAAALCRFRSALQTQVS